MLFRQSQFFNFKDNIDVQCFKFVADHEHVQRVSAKSTDRLGDNQIN